VADLLGQPVGLDPVEDGLEPLVDERPPAFEVLHRRTFGTFDASR
jgi:hypothetical protein